MAQLIRWSVVEDPASWGPPNRPPSWLLPRKEWDRWCWVTWRDRAWWRQVSWDLERPIWYGLVWIGLLSVGDGGWFRGPKARRTWYLRVWRNPRSVWRRRITVLERQLADERAHSRREYERGLAAGRAGLIAELAADRRRERAGHTEGGL